MLGNTYKSHLERGRNYFGDYGAHFFIGMCVQDSSADNMRLGRIKVFIPGVDDSLQSMNELPSCHCLVPCTEEGISGLGQNSMVQQGAQCFGIFLDGDKKQIRLVLGTIPTLTPAEKRIRESKKDVTNKFLNTNEKTEAAISKKKDTVQNNYKKIEGLRSLPKLTGSSNIEKAYRFFLTAKSDYGLDYLQNHHISAILGNLLVESRMKGSELGDSGLFVDINPLAKNPTSKEKTQQIRVFDILNNGKAVDASSNQGAAEFIPPPNFKPENFTGKTIKTNNGVYSLINVRTVERSFGIAQWRAEQSVTDDTLLFKSKRLFLLESLAFNQGTTRNDLAAQLQFIAFEMIVDGRFSANGVYAGANKTAFAKFKTATTIEDAAIFFNRGYTGGTNEKDRIRFSKEVDKVYGITNKPTAGT